MGRLRRFAWLALFLFLVFPASSPPAAADPYHLMIENASLTSVEPVYNVRWVAQSFVPAEDFFVTRIVLIVFEQGTVEPLSVQVRDCCVSGFPGPNVLATGSATVQSFPGQLALDLAPSPLLVAGATYWIVVRSTGVGPGNGHFLGVSGNDLAYPFGTGADSSDNTTWSGLGDDLTFQVYGFQQPNLSFTASPSSPTVGPGQSVTFRAEFLNTGLGTSHALWVNFTLAAELNYTGDDAWLIGGERSGTYSFAFTDVAPGSQAFNVTAQVAGAFPDGTVARSRCTLEATDHNGVAYAPIERELNVTIRNARLSVALTASASDVDPGDRLVLNATVTNLGSDLAVGLLIEGTVDPRATYAASTPQGIYTPSVVRWNISSLGPNATRSFEWHEVVNVGNPDMSTVTGRVRVDYEDVSGARFPTEERTMTTLVHAPTFAPTLQVNRTDAENGQEVSAILRYDNTGSAASTRAWLNWSLGGHYALVSLFPSLSLTAIPDGFLIEQTGVAVGPNAVTARLRVVRGLQDGLAMGLSVSFVATDGNGNRLPPASLASSVELLAPAPAVSLGSASDRFAIESPFVINVTIENAGRAAATGWLNLSLPAGVVYVEDNGTFAATASDGMVSWRILALRPGERIEMAITLRGTASGTAALAFVFEYTDGAGHAPGYATSNPVTMAFVGGGIPWRWGLAGLTFAGILLMVILIVRRPIIEEAFLVSHSGILLAHTPYHPAKYARDRDSMAAMLTAVQDFIRDSFAVAQEGALQSMNFGQRKIVVRGGTSAYIAVILRGPVTSSLPKKMDETLRKLGEWFPRGDDHVDETVLRGAGEVLTHELLGR